MKWVVITGSWRKTNDTVEQDVRREVAIIIQKGDGIVTGGALNVDYFATDEAMIRCPSYKQIKIFLPSTLDRYIKHYRRRAEEGVITTEQAEILAAQLTKIKTKRPGSIVENTDNLIIDQANYYARNTEVVNAADELLAFHVNKSGGVQDTIDKARVRGIPIKVLSYDI